MASSKFISQRFVNPGPILHMSSSCFVAPFQDHTDDLSFGLNYYAGKRHQHAMVLEDTGFARRPAQKSIFHTEQLDLTHLEFQAHSTVVTIWVGWMQFVSVCIAFNIHHDRCLEFIPVAVDTSDHEAWIGTSHQELGVVAWRFLTRFSNFLTILSWVRDSL